MHFLGIAQLGNVDVFWILSPASGVGCYWRPKVCLCDKLAIPGGFAVEHTAFLWVDCLLDWKQCSYVCGTTEQLIRLGQANEHSSASMLISLSKWLCRHSATAPT